MKILELKIISPTKALIRDLKFKESGISIVMADIKKKEDDRETINSLGKTLLLKMIDYLFGADDNTYYFKEEIQGYIVKGVIKYDEQSYSCSRVIGNPENNIIDNRAYSFEEYKNFFSIKRRLLDKQVFLVEKNSLISPRQYPDCNDHLDFLKLLKLEDVGTKVNEIYETQDLIKELKNNRKSLLSSYNLIDLSELEAEIFLVDKKVDEYEGRLKSVTKKIESIQISDLKEDVFQEYTAENSQLKNIKHNMELKKIEKERLERFIAESDKSDIKSKDVLAIYNQANIEVPDMVRKEIQQVQEFHKKVYLERKQYLSNKIFELENEYKVLGLKYEEVAARVDTLGRLISENKAYQEAISYYERFNKELNELKFRQGQLFQLKATQKKIDDYSSKLTKHFEEAKNVLDAKADLVEGYANFIYEFVRGIYNENVTAYFGIKVRSRHLTRRPIEVELNLKGDTGEGVGKVRNLLIDYLAFYYNDELEVLIQDSSCFNGIDPRQVSNIVKELNVLANMSNKQAILSLNKYQVPDDEHNVSFLKENSSIILSEENNLLGFSF